MIGRTQPHDNLRHRPDAGGRMRDSLFWQTTLPEQQLGLQVYLYVSGTGRSGFNVAVWGTDATPLAFEVGGGTVSDTLDFDDFRLSTDTAAVRVRHTELMQSARVDITTDALTLNLSFEGLHPAFSYRDCPDGLPSWFALDRIEQTGRIAGDLRLHGRSQEQDGGRSDGNGGERRVELGPIGHRDHSWGRRDWRAPQHWKWFVAYTPSGQAVNGWIWIARGEWGFAGYVLRDGRPVPVATIEHRTEYTEGLRQRHLDATLIDVEGHRTRLELDVFGLLRLPDERTGTEVREGACTARIEGEAGAGQFETEWPLDYLRHAESV